MIPVSLTIKGLYSYQQETTIDFGPLTAAGLFGIFGAVGSGKSTILEAITFALYGETERLNSRDSRGYNMMNLKSNELLIDFVFASGSPQEKYKFTVNSRRNKKRYLETTAFERKAYHWINNEWQPIIKTADEILGLSYDNFKRTVIIPQGRFQEFLQLKETERVQMLKEIFNLEKYELGPKVALLTKANDLKISHIEGQMQSLPIIDGEALQEKENAIVIHQMQLDEQSVELQKKQQEEKTLETLKQLFADLQNKTNLLNKLQEKEPSFLKLEKEVNDYEKCEKTFKNLFETNDKLVKSINEKSENLTNHKSESDALGNAIKESELLLKHLEESYRNKELLLQKADEIEKIILIKNLKSTVENFLTRVTKGQELIVQKVKDFVDLKNAILLLQESVSAKEQSLPDTNTLIALSSWFANMNQFKNEIIKESKSNSEAQEGLTKTLQNISRELNNFPSTLNFNSIPENIEIVQTSTDKYIILSNKDLLILKEELAHLELSQKLESFVQNIKPGEECPLCGSFHHPKILSVENVTGEIKSIKGKISRIENEIASIQKTLIFLSGLYAEYNSQKQSANKKKENLVKLEKDLEMYKSGFSFPGYTIDDEQRLKDELKQLEEERSSINELRKQIVTKQEEAEKLSKNIIEYKTGVEKISREMAQSEGELRLLESQVLLHVLQDEVVKENDVLQNSITKHKIDFTKITNDYEHASKSLQDNLTKQGTLKGKIEEVQNQLAIENADFKITVHSIQLLLIENGFADKEAVLNILSRKPNLIAEKESISIYKRDLYTAQLQKSEAQNKVTEKQYDEQIHLALNVQITALVIHLREQTELLTNLKRDLFQLKEQLQLREKLQKEFDLLTERSGNLKTLSNLFRSGGFVNHVSSVYLQNLINSANKRFYKMTGQKLLLELTTYNAFQVRDFLNNGEVRSIKTLSGGQMFQAALSLALALADNIQHLTSSNENFFFLDEGFGSLDKDALMVVFETLQQLRKENRIVGVISHIGEMQHIVDINLKIINEPEIGSTIKKSWE